MDCVFRGGSTSFHQIDAELPGGEVLTIPPIEGDAVAGVDREGAGLPSSTKQVARATIRMTNIAIPQASRILLKAKAWGKTWTAASLAIIAPL